MILYPSSALSNPESKSITLPKGMSGLAFQNISSWSWQLTDAHGGDYIILPFGNATIPGASGETFYVTPLSQTQALTINIPLQVGIAFLATAPAAFSQTSQLPVYTMSADVSVDTSGGPVDIEGTVTANISGPVNIQAASGITIPVNGTVDVGTINEKVSTDSNVINAVLNDNPTVSSEPWTGTVNLSSSGSYIIVPIPLGTFDAVQMYVHSQNGSLEDYTFYLKQLRYEPPGQSGNTTYWYPSPNPEFTFTASYDTPDGYQLSDTLVIPLGDSPLSVFNMITLFVQSSVSTSDDLTIVLYLRYASRLVTNPYTNPVNAAAPPNDMADASGTITTGGTSQQVLASDAGRRYLLIVNDASNSDTLWVNFGSTATEGAGSIPLAPGFALEYPAGQYVPSNAVNLIAATTGDAYTVKYA